MVKRTRCKIFRVYWISLFLRVSDGLSIHHQEFKTVHTASTICHTEIPNCASSWFYYRNISLCTVPWTSKITQENYIAFKKKKRNIEPGTLTQHSSPSYTWDGQNNGNTRQYRNKMVCVGNIKSTLAANIFLYSFVCLRCVVPVSKHYRLCLVTVRTKVLQNARLVRFLNTTDCRCMFSWSVCTQNGCFIRCIQSSSIQGYDPISCSLIKQVPRTYSKAGNAKELHIFRLACFWTWEDYKVRLTF
jgi:hypothetical protein